MITTKEIIICKELIDIVDDILHERVTISYENKWAFPENEYLIDVFEDIVNAHNDMLTVYCSLYSNENEALSADIRKQLKAFVAMLTEEKSHGTKLISIATRDILPNDIKQPLDLNTAQFGFHRTSPWKFVENYELNINGQSRCNTATEESPIYTAEGHRADKPMRVIYMPCNQKLKYFYVEMEGGQQ